MLSGMDAPDRSVSRPRHGSRWRSPAIATAAAVVVGVAIVQRAGDDAVPDDGRLSLLTREATDRDRLPEWVADDEAMLVEGLDAASARLARVDGDGRRWFVANARRPAPGGGLLQRLCLISVPDTEPPLPAPTAFLGSGGITSRATAAYACGQPDALRRQFMVVRTSRIAPSDLAGVVPDGYDRVTAGAGDAPVDGNVFVLPAASATADPLVAAGPAGRREAYTGLGAGRPEPDVTPARLDVGLSVLTRPQRPSDRLPPRVALVLAATSAPGARPHLVPGSERALGTAGRIRYWLVRDRRDGRGAVLVEAGPSGLVNSQQVPLPTRRNPVNGVVLTTRPDRFGPAEVRGWLVVPDGFTRATVAGRPVPLAGNALVFQVTLGTGEAVVELRGPAGTLRRTVGDATPSAQPMLPLPTNHVPLAALPALRAAAGSRVGDLRDAVIAAGSAGRVEAVTGRPVASASRLVWVVMATGPGGTRVVVADSRDRDAFDVLDRFTVPEPLDLTPLTRPRPLDLDR